MGRKNTFQTPRVFQCKKLVEFGHVWWVQVASDGSNIQ